MRLLLARGGRDTMAFKSRIVSIGIEITYVNAVIHTEIVKFG